MLRHEQHIVEREGCRQAGLDRCEVQSLCLQVIDKKRLTQGRPDHDVGTVAPWHFLYFFPLPHGHGSFRPTFGSSRRIVFGDGVVTADARRLSAAAAARMDSARRSAAAALPPNGDGASADGLFMISG